ncbi:hypothetical protein M413DRAFT_42581, partial [Hebeloma cylindrosporum]
VIIFASEDVLTAEESERGFLLLELMRSYLELDMFASLTVHTEETLQAGEEEMLRFEKILHKYMELYPDKSWNFPKAHTHRHVWDDIRRKGATRNYNTKPNEKAHRILKLFYQLHTNFKNVIPQLLKLNEADLAHHFIRAALDLLDASVAESLNKESTDLEPVKQIIGTEHVSLGSPSPSMTIATLEATFSSDLAFKDFRKKLGRSLSNRLGSQVRLQQNHQVILNL